MDWIDLAQDRDQWRARVNTIMYVRVPCNLGKFLSFASTLCFPLFNGVELEGKHKGFWH
jgi:hypothetical protein